MERVPPILGVEAETVELGRVRVGGLLGVNPLLLIGSLFYRGDKHVVDYEKGVVDRNRVRKEVENARVMAEDYGLSLGLDVIVETREAAERLLPFILDEAGDLPVFLDSPDPMVRTHMYMLARDLGAVETCVVNGIDSNTGMDEIRAIKESGLKNAVLLAFDPSNPYNSLYPGQRLKLLREKIIPLAREAGVKGFLIDAVVLDPASIAISSSTISLVKEELRLPAGCAPANALGPVSKKTLGSEAAAGIHGGVAAMLRSMGADFVFYGPVKRVKYVAPAAAIVDSMLGYLQRMRGRKPGAHHAMNKLLRRLQKLFTQG